MNTDALQALREADARAREAVRTRFDGTLVLEAGAGTGKTTTLVARVLAWLCDRGWDAAREELGPTADDARVATRALDGILAITFTEAAAADMDAKLRAALAAVEDGRRPVGLADHAFAGPPERLRARAGRLRRALDRPLARTIHAWCRALLSEHALAAGLHPRFEVDVDGRRVREVTREAVVRDLAERLRDAAENEWRLLSQRGVGPSAVEDALVALSLDGTRAGDLRTDPFTPAVVRALQDGLRDAATVFLAECAAALRAQSKGSARYGEVCDQVTALRDALAEPARSGDEWFERVVLARATFTKYAREKLAEWGAGDLSKKMAEGLGESRAAVVERSRALHERLSAFLRQDPPLDRAARGVLGRVLAAVRARLVAQGVETFGDLLCDARALLETRPDVCARVRGGLRQVLVDEFQDTDPVQCALIDALVFAPSPGPRPGLLIVGDPKQSIYGFRSADLRAYDDFVARALVAGGDRHALSLNFRSHQRILDHVEHVMRSAMREESGLQPGFQPLVAARNEGVPVLEHWNAPLAEGVQQPGAAQSRAEAQHVARELQAAQDRGAAWHELGVLFRTRAPLEALLEALRAAAIPFDVVGDRSYYRRREVQDAAALIACVVDPSDLLALVAFLRSPWVGVPDALWLPLRAASGEGGFFACVADLDARRPATVTAVRAAVQAAWARLPDEARAERVAPALDHALESLAALRASFATEPSDVFLEKLRLLVLAEATSGARYQGSYRVANLERFFHEVQTELEESGGDVARLLRRVRGAIGEAQEAGEARPHDGGRSAVQIQTIHGSKGLDYREVFVVGLRAHARTRPAERGRTRVVGDARVLFGAPDPAWIEHERHEARREEAELVRLLYVAMTRAKERLVLSGSLPRRPADAQAGARPAGLLGLLAPAFDGMLEFLHGTGDGDVQDVDGVRYRVLRPSVGTPGAAVPVREARIPEERARADAALLAREGRAAAERSARALVRPMSAPLRRDEDWDVARPRPRTAPSAAALAGTAVHALLETLVLSAEPARALLDARARLPELVRAAAAAGRVDDAEVQAQAERRAHELVEGFARGPLAAELARVAPHVVARELALLTRCDAAPEEGTISAGSIDLLYREPNGLEWVVVDFKTDAVATAEETRAATARHRPQMEAYRDALRRALGLARPPRAELWYLAAGARVALDG